MTNISRSLLNASVKIQLLSVGYKAENINVNTEPPSDGESVALQPEVSSVGQSDAAVERPTDVETGDIKTVALEPSAGNSFPREFTITTRPVSILTYLPFCPKDFRLKSRTAPSRRCLYITPTEPKAIPTPTADFMLKTTTAPVRPTRRKIR